MIETVFSVKPLMYVIILFSFLLGSVPFGILFTKSKGIDIRKVGSKNIGATNVLRSVGKMPAIFTLLGDILKGTAAVFICRIALMTTGKVQSIESSMLIEDFWLGIISLTAVSGHMFSVFLAFRGGKGVATGFGVLSVYTPFVSLIMFLIWIITAIVFRYSSLSALVAFGSLPFLLLLTDASITKISIGLVLTLLILYKHKSNIKNLISGAETKIGEK